MEHQACNIIDKLLSKQEVAFRCDVHVNTVGNWILEGKLPAIRIGERIIRIRESDLQDLFTPYRGGDFSAWNR